jgi:type IV secretion system protein VirD4
MLSGPPGGSPAGSDDVAERAVGIAVVAAGVLAGLVLLTGHLAALVFGGGWPRYRVRDVPGILGRFVTDPLDPAGAWDPVNEGAEVPGALAWWLTLVVPLVAGAAAVLFVMRRAERRERAGAAAVRAREVRRRQLTPSRPGDVVVGTAGGQEIAIRDRRSLLVLGPVRSGKTSAVAIPAVLEWPGPVVATGTGDELVTQTIGWRSQMGDVHVFDPARTTRHHPSGWSPLPSCETWEGAQRTAWNLVMGGKASIGTSSGVGEMWFNSTPRSLAPYLLAAARSDRTMADVARWVDAEERDEPMAVVRVVDPDAAVAHAGTFRREAAVRSSLFHVMARVVGAYRDPTVAASARDHQVEPAEFLDGDPHTLYVVAPHHDQARLRPIFATLVRQVLTAVHEQVERTRTPLEAPLLLLLDDAADVAPVEDLATQAAGAASAGVQVVTVYRDLTELQVRHGRDTAAVLANHRAKLLLPGGAASDDDLNPVVLGDAGDEPPDEEAPVSPGFSTELARDLPANQALLLVDDQEPLRARLRPWFKSRELRRRSGAAQDALLPPESVDVESLSPFAEDAEEPEEGPPSNVSELDAHRRRRAEDDGGAK